jgi:hypothetical protein
MAEIVASPESDVFVALLNLEQGSRIYMDGVSVITMTPAFLGFKDLPVDVFHLVGVRGATTKNEAVITVGFVVFDAPLIRRFDPQSEEVSGEVLDEVTVRNLSLEMKGTKISSPKILLFSSVVSPSQASTWKDQTSYISRELLDKRELAEGHKVVPGCYDDDDRTGEIHQGIVDGKAVRFPSIPVVDSTKDAFRSCKHFGTKRYLKQLLPSARTELFNDIYPSKRILEDVLLRCYQGNWRFLLGDIQLAFALVLNLHCFSSLECWYVSKNATWYIYWKKIFSPLNSGETWLQCFASLNLRESRHNATSTLGFSK